MQNKVLKDKQDRQVIRYWDLIPVCRKEQKECNSKVGVYVCVAWTGVRGRQKTLYVVRM